MGGDAAGKVPRSHESGGLETTIEIKIKTLDSQTYTLRVDKEVPVPALKEQIASVTGVLSEQQRLICQGKVLKDDQLLSAYHVEDGHTLHLVVRQPVPPSDGSSNNPASDPALSTSRGPGGQVAPSVVIETFSVPDHGDGIPPEISRIVSAVLGSFGISNVGGSEGVDVLREHGLQRISTVGSTLEASQVQTEQGGRRSQPDRLQSAFGFPTAVSLGSPPVIPDALTTLSQYLSHMRREFDTVGRGSGNNGQADATQTTEQRDFNSTTLGSVQGRLPTPASLAEVMLSSRQLLTEHVAECLLQLARQLENQANITDPAARLITQSNALRTGVQLHNLGAFLLELGRTIMTVRLDQAPSEAVVNAGPAVFINPSGANPLMVQPFQPGTSFGAIPVGSVHPGSGLVNGIGAGILPRRIDIQIRRGSTATTPNVNREERVDLQQPSGQRNSATGSAGENLVNQTSRVPESPSLSGEPGVRVVPIRTMVTAVPGPFSHISSDSSGNSMGLYYPVVGRFQHASGGRGSQASSENHSADVQTEHQSTTEPAVQEQNVEHRIRDGAVPTPSVRQQEPPRARSININIVSANGAHNNQESDRQIPNSILGILGNLFPGGEIHVEDADLQGTATDSGPENAGTSTSSGLENARTSATPVESDSIVTDEARFLSDLLHEFIPFISQLGEAELNAVPSEETHASEHQTVQASSSQAENSNVGTSRRPSDTDPCSPNSKRQRME